MNGTDQDSVRLLRETNAGIQMGMSSIDDIIDDIDNTELRTVMSDARKEHEQLGGEAHEMLLRYGCDTKEPHPIAKAMSTIKTNVKMAAEHDDKAAAELLTDGCNMGVKKLNQYLNDYSKADPEIKSLTKKVIRSEEKLCKDVRAYL